MQSNIHIRPLVTDYILGIVAAFLACKLYGSPSGHAPIASHLWSVSYILIALSAFLGGTYHGWHGIIDEKFSRCLWKLVVYVLSGASFFFLFATALIVPAGPLHVSILIIALIKLIISVVILISSNRFLPVMIDYLLSLIIAGALCLAFAPLYASAWFVGGIAVSILAAGVQYRKLAPGHGFDHNDIYHILQAIALILIYLGIALL